MYWSLKDFLNTERAIGIKGILPIELLDEETLTARALKFAIKAHENKFRKNGEPYINHSIAVANMVREYGYSNDDIAAAYLHDVVEDTKYTILDIEKYFGNHVAHLVKCESESDKKISWEERKSETINKIAKLSPEECIGLLCDKINNLESIIREQNVIGDAFFEKFNRGKRHQEWYYLNLLNEFKKVFGEHFPLVLRLQVAIAYAFIENEELYDFDKKTLSLNLDKNKNLKA